MSTSVGTLFISRVNSGGEIPQNTAFCSTVCCLCNSAIRCPFCSDGLYRRVSLYRTTLNIQTVDLSPIHLCPSYKMSAYKSAWCYITGDQQ
jgi:hypothetical protein